MSQDPAGDEQPGDTPLPASRRTKLWDAPIRLIHWSFVLLLPALWWTWKSGQMDVHRTLGYVMLGLLVFRLYWGLVGSGPARFASFVRGPRAMIAYVRTLFSKSAEAAVGHNPVGAWSVVSLLLMLVAQVVLGLFAQDTDGLESGPLSKFVSYDLSDAARDWHETGFNIILILVGLHLFAIVFYLLVKRDNLVGPMVTGNKQLPTEATAPALAPVWRALVGVVISCGVVWWVSLGCPIPGLTD